MKSNLIHHMGYVKAHFCHERKRIFYNTNVKIPLKSLDSKKLIKAKAVAGWENLNEQILIAKNQLDNAILDDLRAHGTVDVTRIKDAITLIRYPATASSNVVSIDKGSVLISDMLKDFMSNQPKMNRGIKWRYDLLYKILCKNDLKCNQIKVPYLHERLNEFRGTVNANTASTRFKNFKRFIKWCLESGYTLPTIEWKRLGKPTFKPDFIFLTDERIGQLMRYVPKSDSEAKIKDIFLVLIYTGMRFSDYRSLKIKTEIHDDCIDKIAQKTKTRFKVPIHESIKHILSNPPKMAGQVFNRGVQQLGINLGWVEPIRYQKDINEFVMIPFYEKLCSRVGRHTFATRALLSGVPHNVILGWCGWKNSSMLFYYSEKVKLKTNDWMSKIK